MSVRPPVRVPRPILQPGSHRRPTCASMLTPTPRTPREIVFQHALILRRLSAQMRTLLLKPDAVASPESLRRTLAGSARVFEECADDLEVLAVSASHTHVRVPTCLDGVKVALGFIVPCAAFLGIVALVVSSVPTAPVDPQERLREAREREWMSISEKRLNQAESAR